MQYFYQKGESITHFFSSENGEELSIDAAVDVSLTDNTMQILRGMYNNPNIGFIEIKKEEQDLQLEQNLITLKDMEEIISTPNEKNYERYKNKITLEGYLFLKKVNAAQAQQAPIQQQTQPIPQPVSAI